MWKAIMKSSLSYTFGTRDKRFSSVVCPNGFALCQAQYYPQTKHWNNRPVSWNVFTPTEFCNDNPDCQHLWHLNP